MNGFYLIRGPENHTEEFSFQYNQLRAEDAISPLPNTSGCDFSYPQHDFQYNKAIIPGERHTYTTDGIQQVTNLKKTIVLI